jgi:thioredoxin-like negative regulator of GroEL
MKVLILVLAFLASGSGAMAAAVAVAWRTNAPVFQADAPLTNPPTLLYFTAEWCGYCKVMDRTTLADDAVVRALAGQPAVKIDLDEHPDLAARFQVKGVPAFLLVNDRGEEIARTVGASEAADFKRWLAGAPALAAARAAASAEREARMAELKRRIEQAGGAPEAELVESVLFLAARGEGEAKAFCGTVLADWATKDPERLLGALDHGDLACRLAAGNALQRAIGAEFGLDPWSPSEDRRAAIAALRQRLRTGR